VSNVLQFKIELLDVDPPIWRRIQVPSDYSFWDLHVAIQDSMGWKDSHLHAFQVPGPLGNQMEIGLPDPYGEMDVIPGWERKLGTFFKSPGDKLDYEYDFGDSWCHSVLLEEVTLKSPGASYPSCTAGQGQCPPEDCGGPPGFEMFLEAVADPTHESHAELLAWCGGEFDPLGFTPESVVFDDPQKRLKSLNE